MHRRFTTLEKREFSRLWKVVLFVSISNFLVIFWDLNGLKAEPTKTYFGLKAFFILSPILLTISYRYFEKIREFVQPLITCIFFLYAYYYTAYLHYSYYTSFIQYFFGCVFLMRYTMRMFIPTYLFGLVLFNFAVHAQEPLLSTELFNARSADMWGAILPSFLVSFFAFFYIKNAEQRAETKSLFFEKIGQDVGFLIHEIKRPIGELVKTHESSQIDHLYELLETANIMWPSKKHSESVNMRETDLDLELTQSLEQFKDFFEVLKVRVEKVGHFPKIKSNRSIIGIIFKNIIKNALEELKHDEIIYKSITIESHIFENRLLITFKNRLRPDHKIKVGSIFEAGFTTKDQITNKGIGLYICKELSEKIKILISAKQTKDIISFELDFQDTEIISGQNLLKFNSASNYS